MKKLLFFCLLPALTLPCHAQLTSSEKKVVAWIDGHMDAAMQLLIQSVNINSGTLNVAGVHEVGLLYAKELEKLNFTIEWVHEPDSLRRADHLVATHIGKKGKKLMLIGHLDTVFEPDMSAGPYAKLNDSTATGQGVGDMKGGDVAIITALQALQTIGRLREMNVVVYMTSDEERSGRPHALARKDFIERARTCDIALGFEPGGLNKAVAARRGASSWKVDITAKTGHSATVFSDSAGDGAIYEAARILNSFREQLSAEQYLTFNPGSITGGTGKDNIIAPSAGINGDLRFITDGQKDSARKKMRAIVAASLPGTHSTISFSDGLPAMPPTPGNLRLIDQLNNISNAMGLGDTEAEDPAQRGAGDISDAAPYIDCVDGLGAPGSGAHKPGETINLKQYPLLIERAAILMDRLTR